MDKRKSCIVITAGGTGGHIFPAESLKKGLLNSKKYTVLFVTDTRGSAFIDKSPADDLFVIPTIRLDMKRILALPLELNKFTLAVIRISLIFLRKKPEIVIGFGGYASVPTLVAALLCRVPIVIHESNAVMGRTNKWFLSLSKAAMVNFSDILGVASVFVNKLNITGTPVRECISKVASKKHISSEGFNILVIGGSQGSKVISESVPKAIVSLPEELRNNISVWQQVRPEQVEMAESLYRGMVKNFTVSTFFSDDPKEKLNIGELMLNADLVIARAGASTISEIETLGKPSILIPFAGAKDDHQTHNANSLARKNAAIIIKESDDMVDQLIDVLSGLITNTKAIVEMARNAKSNLHLNSVESIIKIIKIYSRIK